MLLSRRTDSICSGAASSKNITRKRLLCLVHLFIWHRYRNRSMIPYRNGRGEAQGGGGSSVFLWFPFLGMPATGGIVLSAECWTLVCAVRFLSKECLNTRQPLKHAAGVIDRRHALWHPTISLDQIVVPKANTAVCGRKRLQRFSGVAMPIAKQKHDVQNTMIQIA